MKNINKSAIKQCLIIDNNEEKLSLIIGETSILVTTDKTDYDEFYSGVITLANEDGIELENNGLIIKYDYIEAIELEK